VKKRIDKQAAQKNKSEKLDPRKGWLLLEVEGASKSAIAERRRGRYWEKGS